MFKLDEIKIVVIFLATLQYSDTYQLAAFVGSNRNEKEIHLKTLYIKIDDLDNFKKSDSYNDY